VRPYVRIASGQLGRYFSMSFLSERRTPAGKSVIAGKFGKLHNPYSTR
jgi:hypothetical protein